MLLAGLTHVCEVFKCRHGEWARVENIRDTIAFLIRIHEKRRKLKTSP